MGNPCCFICENKPCGWSCIIILFLLGLGCILQLFFVPQAIEDEFNKQNREQIVITQKDQDENNENYQDWVTNTGEDAPIQLFEFWMYNVTNPYDVENGVYPTFDLVGPFTFRRYEEKLNVEFFNEDGESIVSYKVSYNYTYQPDRSTQDATLDDMVYVISGPMMGFFQTLNSGIREELPPGFWPECVDQALANISGDTIFYQVPIRELREGLVDPTLEGPDGIDSYCADNPGFWPQVQPNTFYSLIADGTNGVVQHTGEADINRVAELIEIRNWTIPQTNPASPIAGDGGPLWLDHNETVAGSRETRNFPPEDWVTKDRKLNIWSIEKFRSTQYIFDQDVEWKGVDLLRFRIDPRELRACGADINDTEDEDFNTCKYYQYWEDGVANLTGLRGAPLFMSKGRFLDAPFFINDTSIPFNLSLPNKIEDGQYFDIDSRTGRIFRNFHNYQINFRFSGLIDQPFNNSFSDFNINGKLFPFAYIRVEAIATDDQVEFYKNALAAIDLINGFSLYGGPALGVVFFGLMFFILCKMKQTDRTKGGEFGRLVEDNDNNEQEQISMHPYGGTDA